MEEKNQNLETLQRLWNYSVVFFPAVFDISCSALLVECVSKNKVFYSQCCKVRTSLEGGPNITLMGVNIPALLILRKKIV